MAICNKLDRETRFLVRLSPDWPWGLREGRGRGPIALNKTSPQFKAEAGPKCSTILPAGLNRNPFSGLARTCPHPINLGEIITMSGEIFTTASLAFALVMVGLVLGFALLKIQGAEE